MIVHRSSNGTIQTRSAVKNKSQRLTMLSSSKQRINQNGNNHNLNKQQANKKNQNANNIANNNKNSSNKQFTFKKTFLDYRSALVVKENKFQYNPKVPIMYGLAFNPYCYPDNVFAACGKSIIIAYRCNDDTPGSNGFNALFSHCDTDDIFYACCWSYDLNKQERYFLITAGLKGIIRVIDPIKQKEVKTFHGHGEAINDLKVSPLDPSLLLSASKDYGIRLWNIHTEVCIAIFGGVEGHRDQVVAIDFHQTKSIFASVSIDHSIKIWSLKCTDVDKAIKDSKTYNCDISGRQFPTVSQHFPNFATRYVHHNYIDSVQWFKNFLITKSSDEKLIIWKPGKENETLDDLMRRTHYHTDIDFNVRNVIIMKQFQLTNNNNWYVRFSYDPNEQLLALGDLDGKLYLYDLMSQNPKGYRLVFEILTPKIQVKSNDKYANVIRQTAFNYDGTILVTLNENSCVTRYNVHRITMPKIQRYIQMMENKINNDNNQN